MHIPNEVVYQVIVGYTSTGVTSLHQYLIAEVKIQKFKSHLIAGLSSCDPNLPLYLWSRLIRQAELTLSILHPA